jgi:hypothetical protein
MRNHKTELAGELLAVALLAAVLARQGWLFAIAPRLEQQAALSSELADLRDNKAWGRSLRARLSASEAAYPLRTAALREIDSYFLHDENDRLRILDAWDRAIKQATALRAQPDPASSRAQAFEWRVGEPLNEEANELRRKFGKLYPHDELPAWKPAADTVTVMQLDERLRLSGPVPELFGFLTRVQSESLFFEVTQLSFRQDGAAPDEPVQATVTLSAALFPREGRR